MLHLAGDLEGAASSGHSGAAAVVVMELFILLKHRRVPAIAQYRIDGKRPMPAYEVSVPVIISSVVITQVGQGRFRPKRVATAHADLVWGSHHSANLSELLVKVTFYIV